MKKLKIDDYLNDLDEILKITSKIDLSDIENVDLELLKKQVDKKMEKIKEKYKNLDTKK
jgi:reverse gyrase